MKKTTFIWAVVACALLITIIPGSRPLTLRAEDSALTNSYSQPIENWGELPDGRKWGSVAGLSFDSKGHLWVFERCENDGCADSAQAPIIEFDPSTGKALKSFGSGLFVIPHWIFVDKKDNDNIWVVDQSLKGAKGEQVWKLSPQGKVLMTLGTAGQKGESPNTFNDPTSVVIGANGDVFVTDGHAGRNQTVARVLKFSKDGKFLKTWGKKGQDPGDLDDPHSITIDTQGRLFVADRGNFRVDIFDQDGKLLDSWTQFGIPSGVFVDDHDVLYVGQNFLRPQVPEFGRGIRIGSAKDGKVTGFIEDPDQDPKDSLIGPESVRVGPDGTIYVGEVVRKMVKKYVLK